MDTGNYLHEIQAQQAKIRLTKKADTEAPKKAVTRKDSVETRYYLERVRLLEKKLNARQIEIITLKKENELLTMRLERLL